MRMRTRKFAARAVALAMAAVTVFSVGKLPDVKAADVTDKELIDLEFSNDVEPKQVSEEDAKVICETFGYDSFSGGVHVVPEGAEGYIDWENSSVLYEDVRDTYVFSPILSRDENGKLVIATNEDGSLKVKEGSEGHLCWYESWADDDTARKWPTVIYGDVSCFSPLSKEDTLQLPYTPYPVPLEWWINSNLADPDPMDDPDFECTDVYIIRVTYRDKEEHQSHAVDFWILPEGVSTVLNLEEEQPDPTPSEENYTVDLGDSQTISADAFAEILAENATKDIIIKSNNDVTFTFAKGTMASVDGKTEYDFSTSINNTYADTMPYYITKDNFVSQITFNYSGKLPATAYIRFYAGTQYAGKTLYYSLMNEDKTFAEVQAVVVDADGYMTVKQDHCSSYVVTTTEPKSAGNTADSKDKPTGSPKTGDTTPIALYLALAAAFMGTIVLMKKQKNAGKLY